MTRRRFMQAVAGVLGTIASLYVPTKPWLDGLRKPIVTTWKGAMSAESTDPRNWTDGVPSNGGTVVIPSATRDVDFSNHPELCLDTLEVHGNVGIRFGVTGFLDGKEVRTCGELS